MIFDTTMVTRFFKFRRRILVKCRPTWNSCLAPCPPLVFLGIILLMILRDGPSIQFQERDFELLRELFVCRVMTARHIAATSFDGKWEYTKKRIQKLKAAGFIGERTRRINEPSVLFLTSKAFRLLRDEGRLVAYPPIALSSFEARANVSELTLRHELEVMDVKAAFHSAIRRTEACKLEQFSTWPRLHEFEASSSGYGAKEMTVRPDGFIRIRTMESDGSTTERTFFLEVDRSTEIQDRLVTRAGSYLQFYKSGGFAVKNGAPRSEFKNFPFRVLMIFKTAERRNDTAERLLQSNPPIFTQACLATLEDVKRDPLGSTWICPRDYREATVGTSFDPGQKRPPTWRYIKQPERETLVEKRIRKRRILTDEGSLPANVHRDNHP